MTSASLLPLDLDLACESTADNEGGVLGRLFAPEDLELPSPLDFYTNYSTFSKLTLNKKHSSKIKTNYTAKLKENIVHKSCR